ncbi:uncharacterized protein SCHCODRAFT_02299204 [Schizophyllum commune H4-8]|uniref:uncharacterized protein n=1 Tax=Schizophyllum commune (strain H4-8 / FGSC 9210) TaxID=578458 RepID=UPI00215F722C|nr:uncharacterized protein SCHCODRAFT_02299204 [Schizophyllum commune H4-8]KAI5892710.1 hypothetical protein SCHCODRAFT_02299204 [Schizophyllum commune H4-8]
MIQRSRKSAGGLNAQGVEGTTELRDRRPVEELVEDGSGTGRWASGCRRGSPPDDQRDRRWGVGGPRRAPKVYEYAALRSLMATQLPRTLWARCAPKSASVPVRGCDLDCPPRLECRPRKPIGAPSSRKRWMPGN